MEIPKQTLVLMYERMLKIRHFETRVMELFATGELPGFVHLGLGQEAVAVGSCAALAQDDYITSTHRGHGHIIAKGGDMKQMMAELYGKATGYSKGKGGSMHIASPELGILGATGIVGSGIPLATGAALSAKLRHSNQVALAFFGDGASNEGTFHESLNMASAFNLPIVYVCENNLYAVGTRIDKVCKVPDLSVRATGYGIPGITVDGNDVLAVYQAVRTAVDRARGGMGPSLIECKTYRWRTHFEGEPDTYRPREEVEAWIKKEPIAPFRRRLIEEQVLTEEEATEIEKRVMKEVEECVDFARRSPLPATETALEGLTA
jgi:pyruvate dehydrogenase E1 component alpha subunit